MKLALAILLLGSVSYAKTVKVEVTSKGYEPARIEVAKGEELVLEITRTAKHTCATEITMPSENINEKFPLGKTVTVKLKAAKKGEIAFGCAMKHMIGGVIVVN